MASLFSYSTNAAEYVRDPKLIEQMFFALAPEEMKKREAVAPDKC